MIGFIYCRSAPSDMRVAKSDRIAAQKERCWNFAREHGLTVVRRYTDQGEVHPIELLPSLYRMLETISQEEETVVVLVDHPFRLGRSRNVVEHVIKEIQNRRGIFLPVFSWNEVYLEKFYEAKIKEKYK